MSQPPPPSGFTLVEVLVALASVSVLVAGAAGLLHVASMSMRAARNGTTASLLVQQKIEQLSSSPAALPAGATQDYLAPDGTAVQAATAFFIRRWTVTPSWASSGQTAVTVEIFVPGGARAASAETVIGVGGVSLP